MRVFPRLPTASGFEPMAQLLLGGLETAGSAIDPDPITVI
jgi:hypothetical protein